MSPFLYLQSQQQFQPVINRKKPLCRGIILILVIISGLLVGCAANHSEKYKELLTKDYQSLSDNDLTLYYYELEDQIKVVDRERNSSSIRFGFGLGSYGSDYGGSGGIDATTRRGQADVSINLRDRRDDVELEMKKRNLKP